MALWPLTRTLGSGLALLRFKERPPWGPGFAQAASGVLAMTVDNVLLRAQVHARQDDYTRIFANSRDMVYLSSRDGRWVDVNPAGVEMLGYSSKEELLATPDSAQKAYINPDDRKRFQAAIEKDGFVKDYEVSFKKKNGTPYRGGHYRLGTGTKLGGDGLRGHHQGYYRRQAGPGAD